MVARYWQIEDWKYPDSVNSSFFDIYDLESKCRKWYDMTAAEGFKKREFGFQNIRSVTSSLGVFRLEDI